ncbi:MAG: Pho family two-component response regulator [Limisphaerales bacterium]|nr:MAG: Pho family two-component response regulator [Limisphaerales bacterium]KAG0507272.1 MAG: Pho family two-component response regulator [Limisphaerales bacterium]TXT46753.1 MAG: Pho family two-component response regulator [Limisphaerales bacterium]
MATYLQGRGYEVVIAEDGNRAWEEIKSDLTLRMAIIDWQMPGMSGTEICRRVREELHLVPFYLMLVTASGGKENLVKGLESGADDFLIKPLDKEILLTRVQVGLRSVEQQSRLVDRIMELDATVRQAVDFRRNLPVCGKCKRIRDDSQQWHRVSAFVEGDIPGSFPALLCPECSG